MSEYKNRFPTIEIQRPSGEWIASQLEFPNLTALYRYAAALGRWIGDPHGKVAAVRVVHF